MGQLFHITPIFASGCVAFTKEAEALVPGIETVAVKEGVTVYLDESMKRFETVFPAAGSAGSAVKLTCDELFESSQAAEWIDVCKFI